MGVNNIGNQAEISLSLDISLGPAGSKGGFASTFFLEKYLSQVFLVSFLKNNFDENIFSTIFLAQLILKIFLVKIFLAQFFLKIFFGENIFSKNIFGEKFFGINIFLGKGLHYPSHAHALLYPPPTYNSHPCYLKLRGGGRNKRTHGPDGAMVVPFIYIDYYVSRCQHTDNRDTERCL